MKKPLLLIAIIAFFITGCKLDESGFNQNSINPNTPQTIVGMWFLKSETSVGTALGIPVNETQAGTVNDYYLFKSDNTVQVSTVDDGISNGTYTYDAINKKLTVTNGGETGVFTINSITSNTMVINITVSVPSLGTSLNVTYTYTR